MTAKRSLDRAINGIGQVVVASRPFEKRNYRRYEDSLVRRDCCDLVSLVEHHPRYYRDKQRREGYLER